MPAILTRSLGGSRGGRKETRITLHILRVLQLLRLIMVVKVMGLLLRGTTPQMVLPRVQHFAAQSVQLGQRPRTHLQPINSFVQLFVIGEKLSVFTSPFRF